MFKFVKQILETTDNDHSVFIHLYAVDTKASVSSRKILMGKRFFDLKRFRIYYFPFLRSGLADQITVA